MAKVKDILAFWDSIAPLKLKLDFDNVGLILGFPDAEVSKVLLALDITDDVIDEAVEMGAELIISHHPVIFEAIKQLRADDIKGRKLIKMIQNGISAICLHTNMDTAKGGVNDALMTALGGEVTGLLAPHGVYPDGESCGISRIGILPEPVTLENFLLYIKSSLNCKGLRYVSGGKMVHKLACCGGAGAGDMFAALAAGCDTYITADLKYDHFLWAKEAALNLIDADHFCTENVVVPVMYEKLSQAYPELECRISVRHGQTIDFI